ncbi:MAG: hypothetical protein A2161_19435 [Candidatus Schekmanbacteria bacterium RBG_13_48_7]|uniref:Uncharacterized protein n=1 Tax=Candidatus Schekmanbacteria bacterium RBG_13_48_7 TaxID=1817878 RepID=A0A1F7RVC3_9BACT|nr:MAG: hypothetical protein A2161_19435 [Candidatus Schekmanbacteria bacterium RBG_13_48_7]
MNPNGYDEGKINKLLKELYKEVIELIQEMIAQLGWIKNSSVRFLDDSYIRIALLLFYIYNSD